jgi:arylsulfatase A-like enzyme
LFPTILDMAGARNDERNQSEGDSVSWLPLLKQTAGYPKERALFWHFPVNQRADVGPNSTVRKGAWKLIYFYQDQHYELYNLEQDISESTNLAKQRPDVLKQMANLLRDYLVGTKAQTPTFKSNSKPVPLPGDDL